MDNKKMQNRRRRFEEEACSSSSVEDVTFISDYFAWCVYRHSSYDGMKLKGFCIYHKEDLDKRFTEEQKQKLRDHHSKALMIVI